MVALAAVALSAVAIPAPAKGAASPAGPGAVTVLHVPSADHDLPVRDVYVYRPAVPAGTVLPVLYMLHGYPGHPPALMRWMSAALDTAFAHGARPFAVAMPDGNGTAHQDTEWADSVDRKTLVETSLLTKVLPAVEGSTPLPAGMRAIGGFSMGGYGAANIGLRHPELFGQITAISGYYHIDDPSGMFGKDPAVIAANTPNALVPAASGRRVQLIESTSEPDGLIRGQAVDFAGRLRACHCAAAVELHLDDGDHDVDFVAAETPHVVGFLDSGWQGTDLTPKAVPKRMSAPPVRLPACDDRRAAGLGHGEQPDVLRCPGATTAAAASGAVGCPLCAAGGRPADRPRAAGFGDGG